MALTDRQNRPSRRLREKLGLELDGSQRLDGEDDELALYGWNAPEPGV